MAPGIPIARFSVAKPVDLSSLPDHNAGLSASAVLPLVEIGCRLRVLTMAKPRRVLDRVMESRGTLSFREFEHLLLALGFKHDGTSGSHRIYVHPQVTRPLSVQPRGKDAKPYQMRQLREMIDEFDLKL